MNRQEKIESELEEQFGKLIIKSFAQYYGGYKPKIAGGILSPHNTGMIYIFKDYFIFKSDVAIKNNYWEIIIPISSIIVDNWSYDGKLISKNSSKDGAGIEKIGGTECLVIPYLDNNGIKQRPQFGIMRTLASKMAVGTSSYFGGGGMKKLWQVLYNIIVETHKDKLQAQSAKQIGSEDETKYDIKQWIKDWEDQTLDFKLKDILSDNFKIGRTMVAFGNNIDEQDFGGRLVIGVNNKTREIEGVNFDPKHEEHIMNIARDRCDPSISPIFKKVEFEGKTLYVITIPKMTTTPYRLKTQEGMVHLIRVGSTIREPTSIELARLYNHLSAQTTEDSRQKQILTDLLSSFESIQSKMKSLHGLAKTRELMITQHRELLEKKNNQIDETLKLVQNPLTVINEELKVEVITALQISRHKPAFEAMPPSLVLARQRKMLENGWKKNWPDFDVNSRMMDNDTDEAIIALDSVIKKLKSVLERH